MEGPSLETFITSNLIGLSITLSSVEVDIRIGVGWIIEEEYAIDLFGLSVINIGSGFWSLIWKYGRQETQANSINSLNVITLKLVSKQ